MVLLKPKAKKSVDAECVTRLTVTCMEPNEKATFNMASSAIKWEPLYLGLIHVQINIHIIKRLFATRWKYAFLLRLLRGIRLINHGSQTGSET